MDSRIIAAKNGQGSSTIINRYKKKSRLQKIMKYKFIYILMLPGLVYFLIYRYLPMLGLTIAFNDYHPAMGIKGFFTADWIGFRNFEIFFNSIYFKEIMRNTILISIYKIAFGFPAPIIMALMLNEVSSGWFKKSLQTVTYLPHFISWVVVAGIMYQLLSVTSGAVNDIIRLFYGKPYDFLSNPTTFRGLLVVSEIWKDVGWGSIIYIAALSSVEQEQYESATIDGANRMQRLIYISLPGISSTIIVMFLLRLGHILDVGFEQIFLLYSEKVYDVADIIDTYVYREGLQNGRYGFATAVGLFKNVIGLVMILGANKAINKLGHRGIF